MLSKKELEEIVGAWPDENGVSSNPEVIERWEAMQRQSFQRTVFASAKNNIFLIATPYVTNCTISLKPT